MKQMLKAVVYDFDGTLTPEVVPEFEILERSGLEGGTKNPKFFATVHEVAKRSAIDVYEAMVLVIMDTVRNAGFPLTDANIALGAGDRTFNPGVEDFLDELCHRGVKNFLLSSGSQAYLKHLKIAPCFAEIYATILTYDENGEANGIQRVMSAAEKTIALQEIATRVNGDKGDFTGIVYVGDGPTDVEAMAYIKQHGGRAILIQHDKSDAGLPKVDSNVVDLVTKPDFTEDSALAKYVDGLIAS